DDEMDIEEDEDDDMDIEADEEDEDDERWMRAILLMEGLYLYAPQRREEIRELRAADRTRQQQIIQTLTVVQTLQREMVPLQGVSAANVTNAQL
ncbi:hypothetical protein Tco_1222967, partial [Tanacetum coccineum]